ncbi:MAG: hypothetical protein R6X16_16305, partial [Anaerolineae bacterium]
MRHRPTGHIVAVTILALLCLAACQFSVTPPGTVETPAASSVTRTAELPTIAPPVEPPTLAPTPTPAGPLALPSPRPTRISEIAESEWTSFGNHNDIQLLSSHADGSLWAATAGGVVRWDLAHGTSEVFDSPAGLASQHVTALLTASDGSVWAGTDAGLSRYDGSGWVTYTHQDGLPSDSVTMLLEASDGALWCGTSAGLALYRNGAWETLWMSESGSTAFSTGVETRDGALWFAGGSAGLLRAESTGNVPQLVADGPENPALLVVGTEGLLWAADTEGGLWRYGDVWMAVPLPGEPEPIVALAAAPDGEIWVTLQSRVARLEDGAWSLFTAADGLPEGPYHSLTIGFDGYVWCAGAHGLARYDGSTWQDMTSPEPPLDQHIRALIANQTQGLFVATADGIGLFAGEVWTVFRLSGPFPGHVSDIVQAMDGSLWLGLAEGGALRYAAGDWTEIAAPTDSNGGAPASQRLFAPGDATIWASGPDYLAQLDPISGQILYQSRCLADARQRPLGQTADGSVWLATADGLTVVTPDGVWEEMASPQAAPPAVPTVLLQASNGTLWLGTEEGLYRSDAAGDDLAWKRVTGLRAHAVRAIAESPGGTIWVAFPTALGRGDGIRWEVDTTGQGLAGNDVRALMITGSGELWAGTATGLSRQSSQGWESYTTEDGLAGDGVTSILEAGDNAIWVGTDGGLTRLGADGWTTVTSLPIISGAAGSDGSLWFGTDTGVRRYDALGGYELDNGGLEAGPVTRLLADPQQVVWADTPDGLARLVDGFWITA